MTTDQIREVSLEFVQRMRDGGFSTPDNLTEQSKVAALYEIAAQLSELKSLLSNMNVAMSDPMRQGGAAGAPREFVAEPFVPTGGKASR